MIVLNLTGLCVEKLRAITSNDFVIFKWIVITFYNKKVEIESRVENQRYNYFLKYVLPYM